MKKNKNLLESFNDRVSETAKTLNISNDEAFLIVVKIVNYANDMFDMLFSKYGGK